jgi:hypothetical protein
VTPGSFRGTEIARLLRSGWVRCPSITEAVLAVGLPAITEEYLERAFAEPAWPAAEAAVAGLRERFCSARFADDVRYGVLLVPDPARLDTRRAMPESVRRDQLRTPGDVFDGRLPDGVLGLRPDAPWSLVATVIGRVGPSMGSCLAVKESPAGPFTVLGMDTRALMTRQLWGARVLQGGRDLPDCEANERWTFTLFPGEPLTDGQAESGTVLKGKVRFRLGKPDRGIGSARVAPALDCTSGIAYRRHLPSDSITSPAPCGTR